MKENKITFIDGSLEKQQQAVKDFLNSISEEDHKKAMSKEFNYLDEE